MRYFKLLIKRRYYNEEGNYKDDRKELRLSTYSRFKRGLSSEATDFLLKSLGEPFVDLGCGDPYILLKDYEVKINIHTSFKVCICEEIDKKEFTSIYIVCALLEKELKYFLSDEVF